MAYDPNAPTERERSNHYFMVWIGLAASLAAVASTLLAFPDSLRGLAALIVGAELLIFAVSTRFDSYFRQLRDFGAVVVLAIAALKVRLVGLDFMELRHAPIALRAVFEFYCFAVWAVLSGLYLWL